MFSKRFILVQFILLILLGICSANLNSKVTGTGIKLAVKEDLIEDIKNKFIPGIIGGLTNYTVADQEITLDIKIAKIKIALKNILINLNVTDISDENFQVVFQDPNKISFEIKNIKGEVNFDDYFALSFIKENSHLRAEILSFSIRLDLTLGEVESKQNKGKMLPSITLENITVDLDFNYDIQGNWLVKIANSKLIKNLIIKMIKKQINKIFSGSLKNTINEGIKTKIANLPTDLTLVGDLALDYSLNSSPKIEEGKFLGINSKALIYNSKNLDTENPPFDPKLDIPDYNDNEKLAELLISEFTANSALYTLFLSGMLKATINNSIVPADFPVQLNTTTLDVVFNGISNKYGIDKPVEIQCEAVNYPVVKFKEENLDLGLDFECKIFVFVTESEKEQAYYFKSSLNASMNLALHENGNINVNANFASLENSKMIETTVEETYIENIENLFNFAVNLALPYLNMDFLNDIHVDIPVIKGIDFKNSTLEMKNNYIDIHVTPEIKSEKFLF